MIELIESTPKKLSGITSFLVKFPYNPEIVEAVKQFQPAVYNKKDYTWEISANYLSRLIDTLTYYDNIKLTLLNDEINQISYTPLSEEEIRSFKYKPFDHQIAAINYGISKKKWLLLDAPGCGKSLSAMYYAETLHRRGLIDHCLIIVGFSSLRQNWKNEIQKFSNESVVVIGERRTKTGTLAYDSIPKRAEQLKHKIDEFFVVTNIESLRDKSVIEAISESENQFGLIVVDEIHKCAGLSSSQYDGLKKLKAPYKMAMTGSLITNNALSAAGALMWTENDHATITNYKNQYCKFGDNQFTKYMVVGYQNLDMLKDELDNCSLRRTFETISDSLPKKMVEVEYVEMTDTYKKFYEAIKNGVKEEANKVNLDTSNLLSLLLRMRQATSAPGILTSESMDSPKILRCVDIVEDLVSQGEKVVILANFKDTVYDLGRRLEKFHPSINTGDQKDFNISDNIKRFQEDPNEMVFIGTHARIGTGVTLNAAKYLIMIDTPWTYAAFDQSSGRIYRINNKYPAYIKVLITKDTVDEHVWNIVENKRELGDYLIDDKENSISDSLRDEMKNILLRL